MGIYYDKEAGAKTPNYKHPAADSSWHSKSLEMKYLSSPLKVIVLLAALFQC